ncbi:hypothetical protein [Desulfomicrobium escambiense]|uniref:hypothetical protein n=1 Tax=Desulfomicrobium escambiense TaxID=29503 RepID=UPI0004241F3B|nr:hypothetical protein [Desulfomicrobium escambiense]
MNITQRSYSTTITFDFEQDALTYTRVDAYGSHSFQLPYGSIGMDPRMTSERNGTLFSGAILLSAWGMAQAAYTMIRGDLLGAIFMLPGGLCFLLHAALKTNITSLSSDEGEIAIMHDGNFERIMSEIRERRKKQLLDWYGNIDFGNDPEEEIQKFEWLHSQRIITSDQLQRIVNTIRNADTGDQDRFEDPAPPHQ